MRKILFFVAAMAAFVVTSCGGGDHQTKNLDFDKTISGDPSIAHDYAELIEFNESSATYTLDKVSKEESGRAFDDQNWTIEVSYVVKSDYMKGAPVEMIVEGLKRVPLTADVLNADGKAISGQKGFEMNEENLKNFCETLSKGKDAEGKLVFTHQTNNSSDCDKWFEDEAASVRINAGSYSSSSSSSSNSGSIGGGSYGSDDDSYESNSTDGDSFDVDIDDSADNEDLLNAYSKMVDAYVAAVNSGNAAKVVELSSEMASVYSRLSNATLSASDAAKLARIAGKASGLASKAAKLAGSSAADLMNAAANAYGSYMGSSDDDDDDDDDDDNDDW